MSSESKKQRPILHLKERDESFGNRKIANWGGHRDFPDLEAFERISSGGFAAMREQPLMLIESCQTALTALDSGMHHQRYSVLALVYGFARLAHQNSELMDGFLAKPFWEHRKYTVKSGTLQLAMQFCLNAPNGSPMYGRACTYARALAGFFHEDVPMENIAELIERSGGIEKLAAPGIPSAMPPSIGSPQDHASLGEDAFNDEGDDNDDDHVVDPAAFADDHKPQKPSVRAAAPKLNLAEDLVLHAQSAIVNDVLGVNEGDFVMFLTKVTAKPGAWRGIETLGAFPFKVKRKGKGKGK